MTSNGAIPANENKSDRFIRVAEKRVRAILHNIKLLRQTANRNNYEFSDAQRKKIFSAIRAALNEADGAFKGRDRERNKCKLQ